MNKGTARTALIAAVAVVLGTQIALPADAAHKYQGHVDRNQGGVKQFFREHPKIRSATIGAGVGTAAGAVTGLIAGRGVVRGALIGAGAGAGVGLIRSSRTLKRHPIVKDVATGTAVGLGLGLAGGRGRGTALKATAVGAGVGLAAGLLRKAL